MREGGNVVLAQPFVVDRHGAPIPDDGTLDAFEAAGTLPAPRAGPCLAKIKDRYLLAGGIVQGGGMDGVSATSFLATIGADGKLAATVPGPALPKAVMHLTCEVLGDYLYGFSDSKGWICQEFKSGDIKWSEKGVGKGSIGYADGHCYCRSQGKRGLVALIAPTPAGSKESGRFRPPHRRPLDPAHAELRPCPKPMERQIPDCPH